MTRRRADSIRPVRETRMAEIAEWMAENGGTVAQAAQALKWPFENAKKAWQRVRKRMGAQAI